MYTKVHRNGGMKFVMIYRFGVPHILFIPWVNLVT